MEDTNESTASVVASLIAAAPFGWKRIFLDYELQDTKDQWVSSEIIFAIKRPLLGGATRIDIELGDNLELRHLIREFVKSRLLASGSAGITVRAFIRSAKDFDWKEIVGPPRRLSATLGGDLEAHVRDPSLVKPYAAYADRDEWMARIP